MRRLKRERERERDSLLDQLKGLIYLSSLVYFVHNFKPNRGIGVFGPLYWQDHNLVLGYYLKSVVEFNNYSTRVGIASF